MMDLKGFFLTGWWSERHRSHVRPLWQMIAVLPLFLVYWPARAYVDWMDGKR